MPRPITTPTADPSPVPAWATAPALPAARCCHTGRLTFGRPPAPTSGTAGGARAGACCGSGRRSRPALPEPSMLRKLLLSSAIAALTACGDRSANETAMPDSNPPVSAATRDDNALLAASPLPFQAPPFDRITDPDYQPPIEEGMHQHLAEVRASADNPQPPTSANTL